MSARTLTSLIAVGTGLALVAIAGQAGFSGSVSVSAPIYRVKSGDSLWRIAAIDGITVAQLAGENRLSPTAGLQPGMILTIPPSSYVPAGSSATVSATTPIAATPIAATPAAATPAAVSSAPAAAPASASAAAPAYDPWTFCSTAQFYGGPVGVLPWLLSQSPARLALRPLFVQYAAQYGVSSALLEAIAWQESGWQQGVVSGAQAIGIGQLIPSTAAFIDNDLIGENLDPTQAQDNIHMSAAFLGFLNRVEGGNLCNVIAAYYEGQLNLASYGVFSITDPYVESVEALLPRFE